MKRLLVTGVNGFLGQHLCIFLKSAGYEVIATGRGESMLLCSEEVQYVATELTNNEEVKSLVKKYKPDVIIHNAALSKPDECNANKDLCIKSNVESTRFLLREGAEHFIYISTDFIFGEDGPHSEDAQPAPLNFYGESKLAAEQLVKESGLKNIIVRPAFIYGKIWTGIKPTFLHWIKNSIEQQKIINVVSDQLRTPTLVTDICKGIEKIIVKEATGSMHLAGKDVISPYDMAMKTAKVLQLDASFINKVNSETFPEPVKRARRSGLKIDKATRELQYEPVSFEEGVKLTFQ